MIKKVQRVVQLIQNMGWRYIIFRTGFELKKRTGLLKRKFPVGPVVAAYYTLDEWRASANPFFFESKEAITFSKNLSKSLEDDYKQLSDFKYPFFSSLECNLGADYDWITNPDSGFRYDKDLHWLDVNDYDQKAGDIKFVWEPSRFSHLYTIIRYDYHAGVDCSQRVFSEIERWLDANSINKGPNFKCSQEISLRVLNWTFALYYYKNSPNLKSELFDRIQHYIYWQIEHVYHNINFSRIAVRNNHAITETLTLYLAGLLFPKYPNAMKWKMDGKWWFEKEIAYQIYEDGTFLQFSMNYHRVVVQLLTWAFRLSDLNGEHFNEVVYSRAKKSLSFLLNCMDSKSGWLPNYGNNDGALFFKLSNAHYRNYLPQLEALSCALSLDWKYQQFEDAQWYGSARIEREHEAKADIGFSHFDKGGYYIYKTDDSLSFIRCGNHKDRPAQADNLHLDIWHKGKNMLHDGGTYKYNANNDDLKYFMGTRSHNTVMLDDYDQMEKGARFIWYHWTQCEKIESCEDEESFTFDGIIKAFQHVDKDLRHRRIVKIFKKLGRWEVIDTIQNKPENMEMHQLWHTSYLSELSFEATLSDGGSIPPIIDKGFYSSFYGIKEPCSELKFSTKSDTIHTIITIK